MNLKIIAFFPIVIGLALGTLAASTAYLAPLSLPDDRLIGLELSAPAGADEEGEPIVPATTDGEATVLTPEHLASLRDAGVRYVRVDEFSLSRWPHWGAFLIAALSLGVGALLMRMDTKAQAARAAADAGGAPAVGSPAGALAALRETVDALRAPQRADTLAIVDRLGDALAVHVPAFIDGRTELIARHGLGGYAEIMDAFAAAERTMNRAWSAAADKVNEEAYICLDRASAQLDEAQRVLARIQGAGK